MSRSVFEIVTEEIINKLMEGVVPWQRPWVLEHNSTYNRFSNKNYSMLNRIVLGRQGEYATYKQWQSAKYQVKTGEKSSIVTFWTEFEDKKADPIGYELDGTPIYPKFPVLRYYNVFHISQTNCPEPIRKEGLQEKKFEDIEEAERLIQSYVEREEINLDRDFSSNKAFYNPVDDKITLPKKPQFKDAPSYYSTVFHELIHSTGHSKRLGRLKNGFQEGHYTKEELVAEIGSACLMRQLGIDTTETFDNSASYIDGWIETLSKDPRIIVSAASQAEKAVRRINNNIEDVKSTAA